MDMIIWLKIFTTFVVFHKVKMKRLVVNTTCLELARPFNHQFRLTCSNPSDYHCLLDETFTKEFEVCREWKWIPGGTCAYFNTHGVGNIDGRPCSNSGKWLCPNMQYSSTETTKYPTCHIKKNTVAITTSSFQVASELSSDNNHSTSSPFHETVGIKNERTWIIMGVSLSIGVILLLLSIAVVYRRVANGRDGKESSLRKSDAQTEEHQPLNDSVKENIRDQYDSDKKHIGDEENSAESTPGSQFDPTIIYNEEESIGVYFDSSQSKGSQTDEEKEEDRKLCTELINLIAVEGLKLSQKVLTAVITSTTGKSIAELIADETVLNKVKNIHLSSLNNSLEPENSIHVLKALLQISLAGENHPKSGWTNQVSETDTGIGDDVVRLFNIQKVVQETKNYENIYGESYIRLLDDLIGALTRLDPHAEFKDENNALAYKLDAIKNRRLTKAIIKKKQSEKCDIR